VPFIDYNKGNDWGLVGFEKALSEDDITFVKENIKALNSNDITWSVPEGSSELRICIIPFTS
jgi:lupus La protein